jgi:hypothetical protein
MKLRPLLHSCRDVKVWSQCDKTETNTGGQNEISEENEGLY